MIKLTDATNPDLTATLLIEDGLLVIRSKNAASGAFLKVKVSPTDAMVPLLAAITGEAAAQAAAAAEKDEAEAVAGAERAAAATAKRVSRGKRVPDGAPGGELPS